MNGTIEKTRSAAANRRITGAVIFVILLVCSLVALFPFAWMISSSLKNTTEVFYYPIQWIPKVIRWSNYADVFQKFKFARYFGNTFAVALMVTVGTLFVSILASYSFAKLRFRGNNFLFMIYLSTMMIPWQVYMIPQYLMVSRMGLVDTHLGLAFTSMFTPFGVFLLRQFFRGIPMDYTEAARIDGASHWRICWNVIVPMSRPAIVTLILLTFMSAWNDYLAPLIYLKTESVRTLQIALHYFQGENETDWALLMAGATLSMVPVLILYIFAQKQLIEGMASAGGLKG